MWPHAAQPTSKCGLRDPILITFTIWLERVSACTQSGPLVIGSLKTDFKTRWKPGPISHSRLPRGLSLPVTTVMERQAFYFYKDFYNLYSVPQDPACLRGRGITDYIFRWNQRSDFDLSRTPHCENTLSKLRKTISASKDQMIWAAFLPFPVTPSGSHIPTTHMRRIMRKTGMTAVPGDTFYDFKWSGFVSNISHRRACVSVVAQVL